MRARGLHVGTERGLPALMKFYDKRSEGLTGLSYQEGDLQFSFPNGQTITQLWNGSYTQSGSAVTITNASYNGSIPAGQSLSSPPGFNGAWNSTNSPPTAFTLNGTACSIV